MAAEINPIYRVRLEAGGTQRTTHAVWGAGLSYECQRETGEMFFRTTLQGNLVFVGDDADWITGKISDTRFLAYIDRSNDLGQTWAVEWTGRFYITDCEVSLDDRRVKVQPKVYDSYTSVLDGMDNEYNLIELLPEIQPVRIDKHPLVQVYVAGDGIVSCLANGLSWEQDVSPTTDYDVLHDTYHFSVRPVSTVARATQNDVEYETYEGTIPQPDADGFYEATLESLSGDTYLYISHSVTRLDMDYTEYIYYSVNFYIKDSSDDTELYKYEYYRLYTDLDAHNCSVDLEPTASAPVGATTIHLEVATQMLCARILCDVDEVDGTETAPLSKEDFSYNRNYKRVVGFALGNRYVMTSGAQSLTPTEYGKKDDTYYWAKPSAAEAIYPVGRSSWALTSIWFVNDGNILGFFRSVATKRMELKVAYPLSSVLSVLLAKISSVTHQDGTSYSQFLYASTNPVSGDQKATILMTPKSNLLAGDFSQPASNAPITLAAVLDMLKQVYQCYWHIDASNRFVIEHVSYYRNGGSYSVSPTVGQDLTQLVNLRNCKPLAYATSKYTFEKQEMPERYEFAWMDDVTIPFMGKPIEVVSPYVERGRKESVNVGDFTSDIDYILLASENISKDGFALMAGRMSGSDMILPDETLSVSVYPWLEYNVTVQNGLLAFCYLQRKYWLHDMAARSLVVNQVATQAIGVKRTKLQEVKMPCIGMPDPLKLVKTYLGNGYIKKMTVSLDTRTSKTTLVYEP